MLVGQEGTEIGRAQLCAIICKHRTQLSINLITLHTVRGLYILLKILVFTVNENKAGQYGTSRFLTRQYYDEIEIHVSY